VLGLAVHVAAAVLRSRMLPLGALGLVALGAGAGLALPPLTIDAYPTTYLRAPSVPYQARVDLPQARRLYRENCVACHGPGGAGNGPAGAESPAAARRPEAPLTAQHTAGDLYWWLTNGIQAAGMPGFGARLHRRSALGPDQTSLRALSAGYAARNMGEGRGGPTGAGSSRPISRSRRADAAAVLKEYAGAWCCSCCTSCRSRARA
jgi:putative copper resistance protein D